MTRSLRVGPAILVLISLGAGSVFAWQPAGLREVEEVRRLDSSKSSAAAMSVIVRAHPVAARSADVFWLGSLGGRMQAQSQVAAIQSKRMDVGAAIPQASPEPSPTPSIDDQIRSIEEQIKLLDKKAELEEAQKKLKAAEAANREDVLDIAERTELITKKKGEVDAQKELLLSIFPTGSPPKAGSITGADALTLENQIIAYNSLDKISGGIGAQVLTAINDPGNARIIIYSSSDINSIVQYITLMNQLKQAVKNYKDLLTPPVVIPKGESGSTALASALMAPQLASSVLSSVIDLISMFRTDTTFTTTSVTIDSNALISHVANSLLQQKKGVQIYYPEVLPSNILFMKEDEVLDIIAELNNLLEQKGIAAQRIAEYEAQNEEQKKKNALRFNLPKLKSLNEQVDKINADLLKADDTTLTMPLSSLIKAERLKKAGNKTNSYVLFVKAINWTGTTKLTKNLFTGTKVSHSGGAVVSFILFDNDGAIVSSNTFHDYKGFVNVKSHDKTLQSNVDR